MKNEVIELPLDQIVINQNRARKRPKGAILELSESIKQIGLINPIIVKKLSSKKFEVIAGQGRFEALKLLRATSSEKNIKAKVIVREENELIEDLITIDENIMRHNLDEIQLDDALFRRKQIYETLHPETKQHVAGRSKDKNQKSFSEDAAIKLQINKKTVERSIARASKATTIVKKAREDGKISQSKVDLLVSLSPEDQNEILPIIIDKDVATTRKIVEKARKIGGRAVVLYDAEEKDDSRELKRVIREIKQLSELLSEVSDKEMHFVGKNRLENIKMIEKFISDTEKFLKIQKSQIGYIQAIRKRGNDRVVIKLQK